MDLVRLRPTQQPVRHRIQHKRSLQHLLIIMAYLIFDSKEEAVARSEQAGIAKGLSYHKTGSGSRYWWGVSEEAAEEDPRAFMEIQKNVWTNEETEEEHVSIPDEALLTEEEIESLANSLPEDWVYPPDPMAETDDEEEDPPLDD